MGGYRSVQLRNIFMNVSPLSNLAVIKKYTRKYINVIEQRLESTGGLFSQGAVKNL